MNRITIAIAAGLALAAHPVSASKAESFDLAETIPPEPVRLVGPADIEAAPEGEREDAGEVRRDEWADVALPVAAAVVVAVIAALLLRGGGGEPNRIDPAPVPILL